MPIRTVRYNGKPTKIVLSFRYYQGLKRDVAALAAEQGWTLTKAHAVKRAEIETRCEEDEVYREAVRQMCAEDPLFFINVFGYVVEPRDEKTLPFNTWPHQDEVIAEIVRGWGKEDFVGDKSREQGASWLMAWLFAWAFTFLSNQFIGGGSKDEETADDPEDLGSFGAKIDFALEGLPAWMLVKVDAKERVSVQKHAYRRNIAKHTWKRLGRGGNSIKLFAAGPNLARGGRFTVFFLDEAAFFPPGDDYLADMNLQRVTNCVVWWSTFNGRNNAFYDKVFGDNDSVRLILDWRDNPAHNKGLYTTTSGQLEILDLDFNDGKPLADYAYELDGLERSLWLDQQWIRAGRNMIWLKQELYRDPEGSKGRPFPAPVLEWARGMCRQPIETGMLLFNEHDPADVKAFQWLRSTAYKFDLWRPVDQYGRIYVAKPIVGADIAAGTSGDTSSNSVLSIWDGQSGEQVGEIAINSMYPIDFARLAIATCWWLSYSGETFLIPETNGGAGRTFMEEILRIGYPNLYDADVGGGELTRYSKKGNTPGYHTKKTSTTLEPLLAGLSHQAITPRSAALVAEIGEYEINQRSQWVHPRSVNSRDASALGEGHGDRAMAAAVAIRGMRERGLAGTRKKSRAPEDSLAGRLVQYEMLAQQRALASCRY